MYAYNPNNEWISRHLMSVDGKFEGIGLEDLYTVGERNNVAGYRRVVREVRAGVAGWPSFAAGAELDGETVKTIEADIERFAPR